MNNLITHVLATTVVVLSLTLLVGNVSATAKEKIIDDCLMTGSFRVGDRAFTCTPLSTLTHSTKRTT